MVNNIDYDIDIKEVLNYINPAILNYQEWVNVGMALKDAGYSAADCCLLYTSDAADEL